MRIIILALALASFGVSANEASCLSEIIWSESRGESIEGAVAVGKAVVNRAKRMDKSICKIVGVTRKKPSKELAGYYYALSKYILSVNSNDIVSEADSWNKGRKSGHAGKITRHIGKHVFYVMANL